MLLKQLTVASLTDTYSLSYSYLYFDLQYNILFQGEVSYIRVKEDYRGGRSGSRSRSRSKTPPRHSRGSPSYSPMRRQRSNSPY